MSHTLRDGELTRARPSNSISSDSITMTLPDLPLDDMAARHSGLTDSVASAYYEAASVCLDKHHDPPQEFVLDDGSSQTQALVTCEPPEERCKNAWANDTDATECGAYACALAAAELSHGLVAVRRAETLTGADYYLAAGDSLAEDLEASYRLEVSGTNLGQTEVNSRLRRKIQQTREGTSNLPAVAAVVGFKVRCIRMRFVEEAV